MEMRLPQGVHLGEDDRLIGGLILKLDFQGIMRNIETCAYLADLVPQNWAYSRGRAAEVFSDEQIKKLDAAVAAEVARVNPERAMITTKLAGIEAIPPADLELARAVDSAIAANDVHAVYSTVVPMVPGASLATWMACRDKLKQHFRVRLGVTALDKAVAIERRRPRRHATKAFREPGTIAEWHDALEVMRRWFAPPAWFLARDMAEMARADELRMPGYLNELQADLGFQRAIGRALSKRSGQDYDGLRLIGGFDAHARIGRWRVETVLATPGASPAPPAPTAPTK